MKIGIKISPLTALKAGIPNYIIHLLKGLAEVEKTNEYILYTNKPIPFELNLPDRFKTVIVRFPSPHLQAWYQIGLPMCMKKDGIQLFHDPVYPLPLALPVPGVITVHDLSNYTNPDVHTFRSALSGKLFPVYLRKARQIISVSHFTASQLKKHFPGEAHKITVIHQGNSERFQPLAHQNNLESVKSIYNLPPRFLLFLGTLEPRKNISRLLEAFALSSSSIPHSLVITGGKGWKYDNLLKRIASHPNRDRIHLTGYVDDNHLPALLSAAEFLVYPSILEGFGLPVLEAMACGTPVVTSDVSSMPEIAGDAAFLIDPYSINSISQGINLLGSNEKLRENLSDKGLKRASLFSWRKTALETLEVYAKAVN